MLTKTNVPISALLVLSISNAANAGEIERNARVVSIDLQVREVVSRLVGIMDTSAQAKANPHMPSVRITTCKVSVEEENPKTTFLYQEQALSQNPLKPYRQRFLRISPSSDRRSVQSAIFRLANPEAWIGGCDRPATKRVLNPSDLGDAKCSVFLQQQGEEYVGDTQAGGCPSNYKGAVTVTNRIFLHPSGMETWDRGFDRSGQLVWGAGDVPYQFRKVARQPDWGTALDGSQK